MKRIILAGVAAAAFAWAVPAVADTVVMEDGRRIRGELVSVNRGTVLFDEIPEGSTRRNRLRLNKDEVVRIVFGEGRGGGMGRGRGRGADDGVFGIPRGDDGYGRDDDDPRRPDDDDELFGRGRDDDEFGRGRDDDDEGFRRGRGGEDDDDVLYRDDARRDGVPPAGAGRSRLVTVSARLAWTDTGIDVRVGDILQFRPEGTIQWGSGRQDSAAGEVNSPMNDRRPMPARPAGALLGRIGTSAADVFFIGDDRGSFRVRSGGRLYLGVNDDYLGDNAGSFQVRITH